MGWRGGGRGVGWRIVVSVEELRGGSRGFRSTRWAHPTGVSLDIKIALAGHSSAEVEVLDPKLEPLLRLLL
jgi:hypothetical protein